MTCCYFWVPRKEGCRFPLPIIVFHCRGLSFSIRYISSSFAVFDCVSIVSMSFVRITIMLPFSFRSEHMEHWFFLNAFTSKSCYSLQITYCKNVHILSLSMHYYIEYRISNDFYPNDELFSRLNLHCLIDGFQSMINRVLFIVVPLNALNKSFDGLCFKLFKNYHLITMILGHSDWFSFYQKSHHRYHPIKSQNMTF